MIHKFRQEGEQIKRELAACYLALCEVSEENYDYLISRYDHDKIDEFWEAIQEEFEQTKDISQETVLEDRFNSTKLIDTGDFIKDVKTTISTISYNADAFGGLTPPINKSDAARIGRLKAILSCDLKFKSAITFMEMQGTLTYKEYSAKLTKHIEIEHVVAQASTAVRNEKKEHEENENESAALFTNKKNQWRHGHSETNYNHNQVDGGRQSPWQRNTRGRGGRGNYTGRGGRGRGGNEYYDNDHGRYSPRNDNFPGTCFRCNEWGHTAYQCPNYPQQQQHQEGYPSYEEFMAHPERYCKSPAQDCKGSAHSAIQQEDVPRNANIAIQHLQQQQEQKAAFHMHAQQPYPSRYSGSFSPNM